MERGIVAKARGERWGGVVVTQSPPPKTPHHPGPLLPSPSPQPGEEGEVCLKQRPEAAGLVPPLPVGRECGGRGGGGVVRGRFAACADGPYEAASSSGVYS